MSKKLYTTYYAKLKKIPMEHRRVQISWGTPDWWGPKGCQRKVKLMPNKQVWASIDGCWQPRYREQLQALFESGELKEIVDSLEEGSVLICFEADVSKCHRGILKEFLNEHEMAEVEEFQAEDEIKPLNEQLSLL